MLQPKNFENKKLIAEFMGCEVNETYHSKTYSDYSVKGELVLEFRKKGFRTYGFEDKMMFDNMCFDTSFDWLMEVVGSIEGLGYTVAIWNFQCRIDRLNHEGSWYSIKETKIDATFEAIVEFIKWYNKKK